MTDKYQIGVSRYEKLIMIMLFSVLPVLGGASGQAFQNAPLPDKIGVAIFILMIALIYWLCKKGKSDLDL
jgi:hypothetical protein